ncbi:MAG: hypothetical protein JW810_09760 [Sedimentisphaerales bacterium]|nr:hypothetical protein [Sedimentisphaerales bacterium]
MNRPAIDLIFCEGPRRRIDFRDLDAAVVIFALSFAPADSAPDTPEAVFAGLRIERDSETIQAHWPRPGRRQMTLKVPVRPLAGDARRRRASARLGGSNPWKEAPR